MNKQDNQRTGGQILIDALRIHGVDTVFCVPGESYLAALDAFHDARREVRLITCRHEGGAANMAEAYGKLTGKPGICFVTRGPGATNASIGVHTAFQDSTPMILFVGQVGRSITDREAFQEVDFRRMFGQLAKGAEQIDDAARIPEYVSRAFHMAMNGRKGPVVLALPEDMLREKAAAIDTGPFKPVQASPSADQMSKLQALLSEAEHPMMVVGGSGWTEAACADLKTFAETQNIPVAASFRCQDRMNNESPCYAGFLGPGASAKLGERIKQADLLIVAGARMGEMTTRIYSLLRVPSPKQTLVHVYPCAEELGRVYEADLPICSGMPEFLSLAAGLPAAGAEKRTARCEQARAEFEAYLEPPEAHGPLNLAEAVRKLAGVLPEDAIITNGAGNYAVWPHRFLTFRRLGTQLGPTSGAMGYAVPAAVAAKTACPERAVVAFAGDGEFLMTGQELATAVQYGLGIIVLVVNNGMYGTIRMHQERNYPDRVVGSDLGNPDFAAYARAFGAFGDTVERTEDFIPAFERAMKSGKPAVLDLRVDPEDISPGNTISAIRATA